MRERATEANNPIEQEFLSVIREYERVIYKACYLYANPNAPLNDLYQDVILNIWKAFPKFRKECKISTWIYRIALNISMNYIRGRRNAVLFSSLDDFREKDITMWVEEQSSLPQLEMLYRCIDKLGEIDKAIILLYLDGNSHDEISEIIGLSRTNVGTRIGRIKEQLKKLMI